MNDNSRRKAFGNILRPHAARHMCVCTLPWTPKEKCTRVTRISLLQLHCVLGLPTKGLAVGEAAGEDRHS